MKANEFVPLSERQSTPLVLKATAGLRLLKQEEADNLLNSVREVFKKSGYSVNNDAVEIMDGIDEGIYSWFTINFLLGKSSNCRADNVFPLISYDLSEPSTSSGHSIEKF